MANLNSQLLASRATTPRTANAVSSDAKVKSTGVGIVEVSTSEDATHILRMVRMRSNAVPRFVYLSCDAIATSGAVDVGIYRTADDGGAVVDADLFASAQVVTTALTNTNVMHESTVVDISEKNEPLWQLLDLAADPGVWYDVALTITTDMGGAGTLCLEAQYVDGGA